MAYDLLRVAPERKVPPFKPAWLPWTILLFVIVGGGAFGVVRFWPASEPVNTAWFWTCVIAFPSIAWLVLFFVYLGVLQVPVRTTIDYNNARRVYLGQVRRKASVPLHVLGSAFFFSAQEHENTAQAVTRQQLKLVPQNRFSGDSKTIAARWINPEGFTWMPSDDHADIERHRAILPYVFDTLLRQITPALRALPPRTRLCVKLSVATLLPVTEVEAAWRDTWSALQLRPSANAEIESTGLELIAVDQWIDGKGIAQPDAANLLCVVQLNALLNTVPDTGSAEAGVILLFASSALAMQKQLSSQALLHRPERRDESGIGQGLLQAMLWSGVQSSGLTDQWMTGGAETPLNRALTNQLDAKAVGVLTDNELSGQHNLDFRIGSAGIATPWLCVALALQNTRHTQRKQLISIAQAEWLTLAVVAPRF